MKARRILHELWCTLTLRCPKCGEHLAYNEQEYGNWYCPNCDGNCEDETSIKEPTLDHWQDLRERAAIAAMHGLLSDGRQVNVSHVIKYSIICADELIKKLKGE